MACLGPLSLSDRLSRQNCGGKWQTLHWQTREPVFGCPVGSAVSFARWKTALHVPVQVGTRRTNACDTCRRRRVKCDEVRPVCGQCAKKNRPCNESLPPEFIWVKSGQKGQAMPTSERKVDFAFATTGKASHYKPMALVKTSNIGGGAIIHKYRMTLNATSKKARDKDQSDKIPRSPEMLSLDILRVSFVSAYDNLPDGLALSCVSHNWNDIPRYLGQSVAMDNAVDCMIRTHESFVKDASGTKMRGRNLHFESYHRALLSLQKALGNPKEGTHSTTLSAIAMLTISEQIGRTGANDNYIKHAGGAAAYLRAAGDACVQDPLGRSMMAVCSGMAIVDSFMTGNKCFLSEPEWICIMLDRSNVQYAKAISNQLVLDLSHLTSLLVDVRAARNENDLEATRSVFDRAIELRDGILRTHAEVDGLVGWDDPETCRVTGRLSAIPESPFVLANWFDERLTAHIVLYSWAMVVQINVILDRLNGLLVAQGAGILSDEYVEKKRQESLNNAEQICSSIEYASQFSPLGTTFVAYPMCIAWGQAPAGWKDWMLHELNTITGPMTNCYTPPILDYAFTMFTG